MRPSGIGCKSTHPWPWTPYKAISILSFTLTILVIYSAAAQENLDRRLIASLPGDIVIGALFSVHQAPTSPQHAQTRTCGEVREQYGIQRVEAAFQAIDDINNNESLLPNITLGIEIRDSCWFSPTALEQSIEFIRDSISPNEDVATGNTTHGTPGPIPNNPLCPNKPVRRVKNLVGVIGPGSSTTTIQVQNLLQLFSIPQIGYSATSRDLSDKSFFKYFMRVVPSDFYQAQVMVDVVRKYNWTYISTIHTDGNYGGSGMEAFIKLAHEDNICIATQDSVLSNSEPAVYDAIVKNLLKYPNAPVVVCFCEGKTIQGMLMATRRLDVIGKLLFIGSDGWSDRHDVVEGYEKEALGGLSVRIYSPYIHKFDPYYFNLTVKNNLRNPWFKEFWQTKFNCSLELKSVKYNKTCTGREKLSDRYKQDTKMAFVKKAIWTFANGLHNMQRGLCPESYGMCPSMLPVNGSVFLQYLMNVSFVWGNESVDFDGNGDPPGRYDIMNFQRINSSSYEYINVGSWISGELSIFRELQFISGSSSPPESVCSKPCDKGMVKSIQSESVKCCWVCLQCKENEFLQDEYTCQACPQGWWPDVNITGCFRLPIEYIHWSNTTAIVAMSVACLGFMVTVFVMVVFLRHNDTPVVKASTRELSYIIMIGMYLCYATTFALIAKPTQISCFLSRILPGLSFAMMYAALVTKTNRIARILAGSKKKILTKKPKFMSATAQVFITCLLISVECGIISAMLVFESADSMLAYPALNRVKLICNTTPLGVIAPLGFDFFLIAMCTVYAVKTRNVPENFNEAKFIGFTMYTTLVIWLAFIPTYFGSKSKVITMCLCVSFSAIVALVLLFFPKVYIILFRPEKNNRSAFTTAKNVRCHIGYVSSGVSRNSSHSTSDFNLESPRNHSLEVGHAFKKTDSKKSEENRRSSFNLFERFRISKQDKIAANVAQHIRAVRAAEALDRKTKFKRTDSFHGGEAIVAKSSAHRIVPTVNESPGDSERKRLIAILKNTYGNDADEIPGFEELMRNVRLVPNLQVGCQTTDELFESWIPTLRRRVVRSETILSTLTPDDEEEKFPVRTNAIAHVAKEIVSRNSITSLREEDWAEIDFEIPSTSKQRYPGDRHATSKTQKGTESKQLIGKERIIGAIPKRSSSNHSRRTVNEASNSNKSSTETAELIKHQTKRGRLPSIKSEDSMLEAPGSIVEESASSGSEDTPGSGIYRNIIINLATPESSSRPLSVLSIKSDRNTASLQQIKSPTESKEGVDGWGSTNGKITKVSGQLTPTRKQNGSPPGTTDSNDSRHFKG